MIMMIMNMLLVWLSIVVVVVGFIAVCSVALVVIVVQFPRDVFVGQT